MDDSTGVWQKKLADLLREAAEIKVALDRSDGTVQGVPHYSVIEDAAHELGCELSRRVQALHLAELVAQQPLAARCPECGTRCELRPKQRRMRSGDGPLELQELEGRCPRCRRAFFPSAGESGV